MSFISKRALNRRNYNLIIEPKTGSGGGGLLIYNALTDVPSPPLSVSGNAKVVHDQFIATLLATGAEGFESALTNDTMQGFVCNANGNQGTFSMISATGCFVASAPNTGRYNTTPAGVNYMRYTTPVGSPCTLTFTAPMAGFGFYITGLGNFFGSMFVTLNKTGGGADGPYQLLVNSQVIGSLNFFGVTNTAATYDSVVFGVDDPTDVVGIDDVVFVRSNQIA